ncbi:MAG TPA: hypothetical protein DF296_04655 [Candidatus Margulisbacteria bacterium]|nr:hypothetical protein [Candidatus Margulisiibacteriota bacterium]
MVVVLVPDSYGGCCQCGPVINRQPVDQGKAVLVIGNMEGLTLGIECIVFIFPVQFIIPEVQSLFTDVPLHHHLPGSATPGIIDVAGGKSPVGGISQQIGVIPCYSCQMWHGGHVTMCIVGIDRVSCFVGKRVAGGGSWYTRTRHCSVKIMQMRHQK